MGSAAGASETVRRPLHVWLAELERVRDAAAAGTRPKVTILDVADRAGEPGATPANCMPTSPRSVEVRPWLPHCGASGDPGRVTLVGHCRCMGFTPCAMRSPVFQDGIYLLDGGNSRGPIQDAV